MSDMQKLGMSVKEMKAYEEYPGSVCCESDDKNEDRIIYPCLYLNDNEMPALQGLQVGDMVLLTFKARVKGLNTHEGRKGMKGNYDLELRQGSVKEMPATNSQSASQDDLPSKPKDVMDDLMEEGDDEE